MTKPSPLPARAYLRECFWYDAEIGVLRWKSRPPEHFLTEKRSPLWASRQWNGRYAGRPALSALAANGYLCGTLNGSHVLAHRVAWKLAYGDEPDVIDHIDKNKQNNRLANLRAATKRVNGQNTALYRTNTTGVKGVCRTPIGFSAAIRVSPGIRKSKRFQTLEEASAWRREMEKIHYPNAGPA